MSGIVLALLFAVLGALCAAADGAVLALDPDRRRSDADAAAFVGGRERAHRVLSFARLGAHLAAGTGLAVAFGLDQLPRITAVTVAAGVALLIVVFAETVPRAVGDAVGAPAVRALGRAVRALELVLAPVVWLGARFDAVSRRMLPALRPTEAEREATAEQFRQVVEGDAAVGGEERAILHGVFSLADMSVQEIMVPRVDMVAIDKDTPWSEVLDRVRSSEHARLPVYDDTIDEIIGILYAKDLLPAILAGAPPAGGWMSLVRPATFIPEAKPVDAQLRDFRATSTHIAIVVDEFGGTAGLVTIEDVLEEIVGDIRDEYDREEPPIESRESRRYWVSGGLSLDDLSEALGHRFEREGVTTVGGLVFEMLGRVPQSGEALTLEGFRVVVERVVRRRIERVYFERLEPVGARES